MSKAYCKYLLLSLTAILFSACATPKNNWASRAYHQTKVKYNIFFNGNIAYEEGQQAIRAAAKDDYSTILNLYPVSDHQAAEAATSKMDLSIEKCRKSIKLHSIKKKPKPNSRKMNDPKYRAWLKQEEFNNQLGKVWIRLGVSEFHKGDFLGSIGTFTYVQKHFDYDPDIVAQCQLWTARAYAELGWLYEAEDMLRRVEVDNLKYKNAHYYSSASADVLVKAGHYHEAIPFIKLAIPHEKRKMYRPRFEYVLGQLLEREGRRQEAIEAYGKVLKLTPPLEMDFNAQIRKAELEGTSSLKRLKKMAKRDKYKDQLDCIYGAMGNVCLHAGDTAAALENYKLAIEKSTGDGTQKASALLQAGDIYYTQQAYSEAQPCYAEALTILSSESEEYKRVSRRSESLDELIAASETVILQDSLQRLSTMSEEEQLAIVQDIIARLIEQEKNDSIAAAMAEREAANSELGSVDTRNMIGGSGQSAEWYFYNPNLIKQGKKEFRQRWGNRSLEDNWRRLSKSVSMFAETETTEPQDGGELSWTTDSLQNDSTSALAQSAPSMDTHDPRYYLQQIPRTPEDLLRSDNLIADALVDLIYIYRDKICDTIQSDRAFEEFQRRFVTDPRLPDLYYMYYLGALKREDMDEAALWRDRILERFADSKQAMIVSNPNYFAQLRQSNTEQDSLYERTYQAYKKGEFATVKSNKTYAETNYPLSSLMPRFLFLNAIATARTNGQQAFGEELSDMIERYPEHELSTMAKEMLAMMGQGMTTKKGKGNTNLADLRAEQTEEQPETAEQAAKSFAKETKGESYVLLYLAKNTDEQVLNNLLYEVALFNFSQFLIKDFDLQPLTVFDGGSALRIGGFDSLDQTAWYVGLMQQSELQSVFASMGVEVIQITAENYNLIGKGLHLDDYKAFLRK